MYAPISVVMPCFRCTATIDRAVESVFNQTLQPFEVILVEDCSGDETLTKLYQLKEKYPEGWVKVIPLKKNSGPGTARNRGWELSTQEYVAFLDADDSWHPRKIELQYSWMKEHPKAMLTGHRCLVIKESEQAKLIKEAPLLNEPEEISLQKLLLRNKFLTPSVILRREINFRMIEGKRHSEDYHVWLKVVGSGGAGYFFDCPLAFLYKPEYGSSGLSGNLWRLERGELDTYRRIYKDGHIRFFKFLLVSVFSFAKYLRRVAFVLLRRT